MRVPLISRAITVISASIAIGTGLVVLAGYFFETPLLINLRLIFLQWALTLAAVALLVGMLNLLLVHVNKLSAGGTGASYSLVLVLSLVATFALGAFFGPDHAWPRWIFEHIQVPVESSLMALLAVSLAFASARLLQRRTSLFSLVFVAITVLVLLGTGSVFGGTLPFVSDIVRPWLAQVPAAAGARGLLLGVALGTIATGLRVLMGADRPYGG